MEKIIHITTPKANKEHICEVCGKPIHKGERYLNIAVKRNGKMVSRKTHMGCSEPQNTPKIYTKPSVPSTEEQFKEQVHADTLALLHTFTFRENMDIAYTPLIITEVAWHYAFEVLKVAAKNRISETKKLSRAIKAMREKYISDCRKDLDIKHIEKMQNAGEDFICKARNDFAILHYSISNQLLKDSPDLPFIDMRSDACIVIILLELLKEHNARMNKVISEKLKEEIPPINNPINDALRECMDAFVSPAKFEWSQHVATSMKIMQKHIANIEYDIK